MSKPGYEVRPTWLNRYVQGVLEAHRAIMGTSDAPHSVKPSTRSLKEESVLGSVLRVLPAIANAVGATIPVMMDGGVRRGSDVLKAIALGATFVFVGRPFVYAAAIGGEAGVGHAISILSTEICRNMGLLGINSLGELHSDRLFSLNGQSLDAAQVGK